MKIVVRVGQNSSLVRRIDKVFSCDEKVKYGREITATKAWRKMREKGEWGLVPYKCRHCPAWHIGHTH